MLTCYGSVVYSSSELYGQTEDSAGSVHVFGEEIDVAKVLGLIKSSTSTLMLGLNIRAGVFQHNVWRDSSMGRSFWRGVYDKKTMLKL